MVGPEESVPAAPKVRGPRLGGEPLHVTAGHTRSVAGRRRGRLRSRHGQSRSNQKELSDASGRCGDRAHGPTVDKAGPGLKRKPANGQKPPPTGLPRLLKSFSKPAAG